MAPAVPPGPPQEIDREQTADKTAKAARLHLILVMRLPRIEIDHQV
jgi:hypothetical protein